MSLACFWHDSKDQTVEFLRQVLSTEESSGDELDKNPLEIRGKIPANGSTYLAIHS